MAETKPASTKDAPVAGQMGDPRVDPFDVYKPTPTQEENDRAAMGEHVEEKEPDGSPDMVFDTPSPSGHRPGHEARGAQKKSQEPGRPSANYATRTMTPRPGASGPQGGESR